jgi:hypothetical protein
MSLYMTAKDVDTYGMYLVVNCYETKYVKEFTFLICQFNNDLKVLLTYIHKMLTDTFPICPLNDD